MLEFGKISLTMTTIDQLKQFRQGVYTILGNAKDALFDLMDAVLVTRSVYSFVELSLSPVFRRQWSSIYEALSDSKPPRGVDAVVYRTTSSNRTNRISRRSYGLAKT
jgi:hypothetical protein